MLSARQTFYRLRQAAYRQSNNIETYAGKQTTAIGYLDRQPHNCSRRARRKEQDILGIDILGEQVRQSLDARHAGHQVVAGLRSYKPFDHQACTPFRLESTETEYAASSVGLYQARQGPAEAQAAWTNISIGKTLDDQQSRSTQVPASFGSKEDFDSDGDFEYLTNKSIKVKVFQISNPPTKAASKLGILEYLQRRSKKASS